MRSALPGYERPLLDEPLVIVSYAYSGIVRLHELVEKVPGSEWIGTDLVRACDQLAANWREVEAHGDSFSRMAQTSIRSVLGTMVTTRLAASGATRYAFPCSSNAQMVERFATLYPKARLVCLHRTILDVVFSAVTGNPWGLSGTVFDQFAMAFPGNSVAAVTAYWIQQTQQLLALEQVFPDRVLRVTYEGLDASPDTIADSIAALLAVPRPDRPLTWGSAPPRTVNGEGAGARGPTPVGCGRVVPVERVPAGMQAEINRLLEQLQYEPLSESTTTDHK